MFSSNSIAVFRRMYISITSVNLLITPWWSWAHLVRSNWHATDARVRIWGQDSKSWQLVGPDETLSATTCFLAEMKHFFEVARELPIRFALDDGIAALQMALQAKPENKSLEETGALR